MNVRNTTIEPIQANGAVLRTIIVHSPATSGWRASNVVLCMVRDAPRARMPPPPHPQVPAVDGPPAREGVDRSRGRMTPQDRGGGALSKIASASSTASATSPGRSAPASRSESSTGEVGGITRMSVWPRARRLERIP